MSKTIVPDTSVIVDGRITQLIQAGEFKECRIILPAAVISELEHQANLNKETGFDGLQEITSLQQLAKQQKIIIVAEGERPSLEEIRGAKKGFIDAKIREIAKVHKALLITSDKVQHEVAKAEGIDVLYLEPVMVERTLPFLSFFTPKTISVHLKEKTVPLAKVSDRPGKVELIKIRKEKMSVEEIKRIAKETMEAAKKGTDAYVEIDRKGATVVQIAEYRIAITRLPFSDGLEMTIVRPIAKFALEDYPLSKKLKQRLVERAEGVIICGPPGSGKSTLAAALAEFYLAQNKIVKTMESPRDLQVVDEITQYAPLEGSFEKTSDILLLVRPDYSIYDEMRKTEDFRIFSDMRMAGIGMVGIVHANKAIDAVQRFIGRVELGIIPHIIDTVIFMKHGEVKKVYALAFAVKVPSGMMEADLARPVIEVLDFETSEPEYEIYKFGEETVVLPIQEEYKVNKKEKQEKLESIISRMVEREFRVDFSGNKAVLYLHPKDIARVLGKKGKTISQIERSAGIKIDVREEN